MPDKPMRSPSDSHVQRRAELDMISWLNEELGCVLGPERIELAQKSWVEVDGICRNPLVVCEAWAHQGPPKAAQKMKVMNDAMKLLVVRRALGSHARAILLFADEEAADHFRGNSWHATALQDFDLEVVVAKIPQGLKQDLKAAQTDQYR